MMTSPGCVGWTGKGQEAVDKSRDGPVVVGVGGKHFGPPARADLVAVEMIAEVKAGKIAGMEFEMMVVGEESLAN